MVLGSRASRWPPAPAQTPYRAPETRPAALVNADPAARRAAGVRPAVVAAVRGSGARCSSRPRRCRRISTCGSPSRASIRRARSSTMCRCDRYPTVSRGRVDRSQGAGHSRLHRRADSDLHLPRRLRRVLGDRSVRPRPVRDPCGVGDGRRALEAALDDVRVSVAAEVARNYFELRGLQQQLAVAERSLTNQRETLRLTTVRRDAGIRRGAGRRQRGGARGRRSKRACRRCGPRSRRASIGSRC